MRDKEIWRELAYVCNGGGGCVIVEKKAGCVLIWDSKNPHGPRLVFSKKEYAEFRRRVRGDVWPRMVLRFIACFVWPILGTRHVTS